MNHNAALLDIETRFLSTLPKKELSEANRLFFQLELAHWYYDDLLVDKYSNLPRYTGLKAFAKSLGEQSPLFKSANNDFDELFKSFWKYRHRIPVAGCILLNNTMDKFLLVRSFSGKSWGFPKGKLNENESAYLCAIRETFEETGFDAIDYCNENDVLIVEDSGRIMRLFIGVDVPEDYNFEPQTRKEVSKIEFHSIDSLPKKHFNILPFINKLKKWISLKKLQKSIAIKKEKRKIKKQQKQKLLIKFDIKQILNAYEN